MERGRRERNDVIGADVIVRHQVRQSNFTALLQSFKEGGGGSAAAEAMNPTAEADATVTRERKRQERDGQRQRDREGQRLLSE